MTDEPNERERRLHAQVESLPTVGLEEFRRRSRRSFIAGAVGVTGALVGFRWLQNRPADGGVPQPLRSAFRFNERVWTNVAQERSAPEFAVSEATPIRVNGRVGIRTPIDVSAWTVRVEGPDGELLDEVDIATFEALPQHDLVIEHKCVEGWSSVVHWGGARFSDFHQRYADQVGKVPYVSLETPDGLYYVGWDMPAIMHPQTLLVLREGTEPLDADHGAPLRIATPNKYGIKCLKRIGVIRYSRERPSDYWAERGYDWYAGL